MTYLEAKTLHGDLIRQADAAKILNVSRAAINDYIKRNILTRVIVTNEDESKTNFVIASEVYRLAEKRKEKGIHITGNNNIVTGNGNINIKK
ncbi:MAG: hypothetical protein PHH77_02285 [Victivallaceae bacterium]|nr:hypothetical protein [Victivallaceae bacterium]MDD5697420.1 hypothetical protein [Victivallaceae bacterium]